MIGDELSDFFFIRFELGSETVSLDYRSDVSGIVSLFDERINPRSAYFVVFDKVFYGGASIVMFQYPFSQVQ
jgi:hypothetical protein